MRTDGFGDAATKARLSAGMLNGVGGDRLAEIAGEEPLLRPHNPPIVTQRVEQFRREHDVTVLVALALGHPDHHPLVVERAGLQANGFGNAQTGGVAGLQDGLVFDVFDATEKMENFGSAENDRQLLGLPGSRDARFQVPASLEGNIVEEAKGGSGDDDRTRRQLSLVRQVQLIVTYLFRTQQFRRFTKVTGEQGDMQNIRGLGVRRQVPHLHVLDHALPKEGHRKLLCEVEWAAHAATQALANRASQGPERSADERNDAPTDRL